MIAPSVRRRTIMKIILAILGLCGALIMIVAFFYFISGVPERWYECNRWNWQSQTPSESEIVHRERNQLLTSLRQSQQSYLRTKPLPESKRFYTTDAQARFLSRPILDVAVHANRATIVLGDAPNTYRLRQEPDMGYINIWLKLFSAKHGVNWETTCARASYVDQKGVPVMNGDGRSEEDCCLAVL